MTILHFCSASVHFISKLFLCDWIQIKVFALFKSYIIPAT